MTPRWQSPRRLVQPVAKAAVPTKASEAARRSSASKSGMQSDRRRGWHRGARR